MSDISAPKAGSSPSIKETAVALLVLTVFGGGVGMLSGSLPPAIVTNLSAPPETWVRFEGAIVADARLNSDVEALSGEINNDIIAYLRTVSLAQIEGPSGFQLLRQALNERVAIRSKGKVSELAIRTLVVQ